ncbi:hypothetical protein TBLA_0J00280 [Henningerozyma blattae CBS 6284]|uniref:Major facilitator superfamily (MFS) profile domain-containing protein n=1 Tax=Henningerozyma blattae (strain ATCC 34711 / CBS 6284 / DSM 70876 / NBRC 10599 / NRRL Y-10934 / UCD 77-7) TaxID=1071380 RepID=I2H9H6_HENB6|nr:hypothetical protein TBLA_0J00280 [Tetrapisispora blattae CBS 6284]CCH63028.1 hypothetical protein TBLA_0J00280 [Tetrapisispora blattae CBS 6284]
MKITREAKEASKDIKLLWASVFLRLLSYGLTSQVLTLFLDEIHLSEDKMGLFMSLTLIGDVLCSYILTWYADIWGRRNVLIYGALMMTFSGIAFAFSENFHVLLLFAIIGVISPSSNEVGPFKSIEEAIIAHLTPHNKRPEIYAIHGFMGSVGTALGSLLCGTVVHFLNSSELVTTKLQSYKMIFLIYAMIGVFKVIIMISLSEETEKDGNHGDIYDDDSHNDQQVTTDSQASEIETIDTEGTPLLESSTTSINKNQSSIPTAGSLSPETKSVLYRLLVIFMVDSLGSGFMPDSWMVYYYAKIFLMSSFGLGVLFAVAQVIMASTTIPSSWVARYFGPVKGTISVQAPSAIFMIIIPFVESHLSLSITMLLLHFATTSMDVTSRQILLTNIVKPRDLTRVMGIVNIGKIFARCVGPLFTGILASKGYLWLCYIIDGSFVLVADLLLSIWFLDVDAKIIRQFNS